MAPLSHLVSRFAGSLWPLGPRRAEHEWAMANLGEGEQELWLLMSRADRRHAIAVARRAVMALGPDCGSAVIAAALLHDVGKLDSSLGTMGRVIATLCAAFVGSDMAEVWSSGRGFTRRVGLYLRHDALGANRLVLAGSDPLVVAWSREHHLTEDQWTVDIDTGRALKSADDD